MLKTRPGWFEALFPWEQHSILVNGRRMSYIDEGPRGGRPVLLLSGNPTWGFLYRDFIRPLTAAGYRAIAPDWIGAGYSDHPPHDASLTFAHHVADLVSLLAPKGPIYDAADYRRRFADGRIGSDPSLASIEAGRRLFETSVADVVQTYKDFLAAD